MTTSRSMHTSLSLSFKSMKKDGQELYPCQYYITSGNSGKDFTSHNKLFAWDKMEGMEISGSSEISCWIAT